MKPYVEKHFIWYIWKTKLCPKFEYKCILNALILDAFDISIKLWKDVCKN